MQLPFAHLNLRFNPFGDLPAADRAELAVIDAPTLDELVARLAVPGNAVQFIGEAGRGKTTHLLALHASFPAAPYVHFPDDGPLPPVPRAALLFLDELQRLPAAARRRVLRRDGSFAIASHRDHTRELQSCGVQVHSVRLQGCDVARLEAIVQRRIEWARRGPGAVPRLSPAAAQRLVDRFGDDIRAVEEHLYFRFQRLPGVGDVEV
jgi:hypothetical protein